MGSVHVSEVIPVVVDPNHERYGQSGTMIASDREFGDCMFSFEGEHVVLNDGWKTNLPQFIAPLRSEAVGVGRLQTALPGMQDTLRAMFTAVCTLDRRRDAKKIAAIGHDFRLLLNNVIDGPEVPPSEVQS